jgi:hypothetical protein
MDRNRLGSRAQNAETAKTGECFAKFAERFIAAVIYLFGSENMSTATTTSEKVVFNFQDLEITRSTLVIRFFDENVVIPLKEIASWQLKWHLHDPIFANKCWFLVLTLGLKNAEEQSWPIAVVKFKYVDDEHELREQIEGKVRKAMNLAVTRRGAVRLRKK